jgi:hypothetical protein
MVQIRSLNDIILGSLDFYRTAQPDLDVKPGTVARDLVIDGPAVQISRLYEELALVADSQSLALSIGSDLDLWASNFGAVRKQGSRSSLTAIFTFTSIDYDIAITKGSLVFATNGSSFEVVNSTTISVVSKNTYRAVASKYKADLDFVGITDQYAVEITVEATTTGTAGNISKYALSSTSLSGISHVTNAVSAGGGSDAETDSAFKRRIIGIFSGANTGTSTGYRNAVIADPEVIDALVVGPGDTLMTRDGTVVNTLSNGSKVIISEGTGGKVDIYTFGFRLTQILDSFIYRDKSNKNDPTNTVNDFVLGQIAADSGKSITRKRVDNLQSNTLPNQPVNNVIEVFGSISGSNFTQKTTDSLGRVSGNYELIRDTGAYAGSPWGFDKLHWIDNNIRAFAEDDTKGKFNSIDPTGFPDVTSISKITQNIQVTNENSIVLASNRSYIQLSHYPISSVSRVFNQTTGERYIVSNQNPDGTTGSLNQTGRIIITGSTLPAVSDTLQVDYTWVFNYDPSYDFDNKSTTIDNPRSVTDSIDWGYSNSVRREEVTVSTLSNQKIVTVTHPISSVVNVNSFVNDASIVTLISGRKAVTVSSAAVLNVISVTTASNNAELYKTGANNGSFNGFTVFLPTDTTASIGESVFVRYNAVDNFMVSGISGSFNQNIITLPPAATITPGTIVETSYLADIRQLVPALALSSLPATRSYNFFTNSTAAIFGTQPTTHIYSTGTTVIKNLRLAPTRLKATISGTISPGVVTVLGTSFQGVFSSVVVATVNGLKQDLSTAIRTALSLSSTQSIPSEVSIVKLVKMEKVETTTNLDVLSTLATFDIKGYKLNSNTFVKEECLADSSLTVKQVQLPLTTNNQTNIPVIGDKLRVTFYISKTLDTENIYFSKAGSLYTNKIFAFVDSIYISSGFASTASQNATITIAPQNQPAQGSRYTAYYDYLAPKLNERISVRYNKNNVITDNTFAIERVRPIGADVLVKSADPIVVNVSLSIVIQTGFSNSKDVIAQNVKDVIVSSLNSTSLGTTIDSSDLIPIAYSINGVDAATIISFNKSDVAGSVKYITAQKNQYIQAGTVTITVGTR